jgi:hypothetical protein
MALLVRIKRKLNEEPLESVVLGRQSNSKRANLDDLRHALQETSLNPQVFRLLTTASDSTSLPSDLLDTIARRKNEWGSKVRRSSPRKSVKSTFEQPRLGSLLEGQTQQSKAHRQTRVWNCRRVKVQGFSVLEFSGDERAKEAASSKSLEPWLLKHQPFRRDVPTAERLRDIEQESKARAADTKTLRRAQGWRRWQQQHRPEPTTPQVTQDTPSPETPVPQQYADMLKEYYGKENDGDTLNQPVNVHLSLPCISSSSCLASSTSSLCPPSSDTSMAASSNFQSSSSERDFVWDLYYCCGSEMEPDPNALELTYESEVSEAESEDSNAKEYDYSEEESSEAEGDCSNGESEEDSDGGVLNRRMYRKEENTEEWNEED